jgi:hypothetical protein
MKIFVIIGVFLALSGCASSQKRCEESGGTYQCKTVQIQAYSYQYMDGTCFGMATQGMRLDTLSQRAYKDCMRRMSQATVPRTHCNCKKNKSELINPKDGANSDSTEITWNAGQIHGYRRGQKVTMQDCMAKQPLSDTYYKTRKKCVKSLEAISDESLGERLKAMSDESLEERLKEVRAIKARKCKSIPGGYLGTNKKCDFDEDEFSKVMLTEAEDYKRRRKRGQARIKSGPN